jgi:hypothetical protein
MRVHQAYPMTPHAKITGKVFLHIWFFQEYAQPTARDQSNKNPPADHRPSLKKNLYYIHSMQNMQNIQRM